MIFHADTGGGVMDPAVSAAKRTIREERAWFA
jgi:hypothetical protein